MTRQPPAVGRVGARAYRVPAPGPEADGTLAWDATTIVVVRVDAGGVPGLGWTYADAACVPLIEGKLASVVEGRPLTDVPAAWTAMQRAIRNLGRPGLVSCALSAVDVALWDAAARWLDVPVSRLLGRVRESVDVYGSGGFTTLSDDELTAQLSHWAHEQRIPRVKIKIGESWGGELDRDLHRVALARDVIGDDAALYVDANGAYSAGQAGRLLEPLRDAGVTWFEEPVSSDDLAGLGRLRTPGGPDIAAGEYGYDLPCFARLLPVVDCLQVDVTRCGGFTEWRRAAALAAAAGRDVSAHCAPNLSAHAAVATPNFRHIEWFADHDRIERRFFAGCLDPAGGTSRMRGPQPPRKSPPLAGRATPMGPATAAATELASTPPEGRPMTHKPTPTNKLAAAHRQGRADDPQGRTHHPARPRSPEGHPMTHKPTSTPAHRRAAR